MAMMKWIDIPPVWLLGCLVLTYGLSKVDVSFAVFDLVALRFLGAAVFLLGLGLAVVAVIQMRRHKTTVIPHLTASRLVTTGLFARSRNPIYLGDMLMLAGYILWSGALLAIPLVLVLFIALERRFILPEEDRLLRSFGADFTAYTERTGRWL